MIYIDNGKKVIEYDTNRKMEKAIQTLLDEFEDMHSAETVDMEVAIVKKGGKKEWE